MEKLYNRIDWHNNTSPAINETNLNRMSKAVDDIDDRVVDIAGTVMETVPQIQEDLAEAQELLEDAEEISTHPPIIGQNGNWWVWDTSIDDYADSGVDAGVSLSIGSTTTLPAGSDATVTNTGTATDPILNFGIPRGETGAGVPTGGTTGQVLKKKSGTNYDTEWGDIKQDGITGVTVNRFGECTTQANVNDKYVSITEGTFSLEAGAKVTVKFRYTNTATAPRLKVGNTLAEDIYYRGVRVGSSAPAGVLNGVIDFVYDGTNYNIVGTFVNTTYESKAAVSGGTALSLVTTGEKYNWNNPPSSGHTILNDSGTAMAQRSKLQFDGLNVSDDSGNDKTIVKSPIFNGTTAQWEALSSAEKAKYTVVNLTDDYGYSDYSSIDPSNSSVEVYIDTGGRRCYIEKIGNIVFWQVILKVKSSLAANTFHTLYNNLPSAITSKTNSGISGYVAHKTTGEFILPIAVWPGATGTLGIYSTQNLTTDYAIVLNGFYMTD